MRKDEFIAKMDEWAIQCALAGMGGSEIDEQRALDKKKELVTELDRLYKDDQK